MPARTWNFISGIMCAVPVHAVQGNKSPIQFILRERIPEATTPWRTPRSGLKNRRRGSHGNLGGSIVVVVVVGADDACGSSSGGKCKRQEEVRLTSRGGGGQAGRERESPPKVAWRGRPRGGRGGEYVRYTGVCTLFRVFARAGEYDGGDVSLNI